MEESIFAALAILFGLREGISQESLLAKRLTLTIDLGLLYIVNLVEPLNTVKEKGLQVQSTLERGKDYVGVGVGAVIVEDQQILLIKRLKPPEAGYWAIQGGAVEFGETIEHAIKREVKEELDVESDIVTLLGVTDHILPAEGVHWVAPVFLIKITGTPAMLKPTSTVASSGSPLRICLNRLH